MENVKLEPCSKFWKTVNRTRSSFFWLLSGIIVGFTKDNFFSWRNFGNLASNTAVRFLIALGVSGCLITKGHRPVRRSSGWLCRVPCGRSAAESQLRRQTLPEYA